MEFTSCLSRAIYFTHVALQIHLRKKEKVSALKLVFRTSSDAYKGEYLFSQITQQHISRDSVNQ